ncbi:ABC transporter ATP-binding protein [Methanothrix soehngenii]|uniref:ABC transporter ATP-binding protein n=1 Tax=Methanothrix soehngenii TaxID=2223 RepID=UPI003B595B0B
MVELLALDDVDLTILEGEFLSITGPSGSGKSTLLNMLGLLDKPSGGEILLKGREVSQSNSMERSRLRNKELGFIFQYQHLLPEFTALENVMIPQLIAGVDKKAARDRSEELLQEMGLEERLNHKPSELSGGQSQRVAVARALANRPSIVIGDEPTGNLDTKSSEMVYELLRKLNREIKQTFILVTHDMSMAQKTDRILRLVDGRIVSEMRRENGGFVECL